jgi:hypothetical protein
MAEGKQFTVRFATRAVTFKTDRYRDRGDLAKAVREGVVLSCIEQVTANGSMGRQTWLNLALVEQIL